MSETKTSSPIEVLAAVIRRGDARGRLGSDPEAFLMGLGLPEQDRREMLALGPKRLMAYRALVHNRARKVVFNFLPRCRAALGEGRLRAEVEAFLADAGIVSPYLREVPSEFVAWAAPRWRADPDAPRWIPDLARYELLAEGLPNDPREVGEATELPVALDRPIRINGTARVERFEHRVIDRDTEAPVQDATRILVCRDHEHRYRELELDPLAAALFEALAEGHNLREAVDAAAEATRQEVADPLLEAASLSLAAMFDIDALLGAEPR